MRAGVKRTERAPRGRRAWLLFAGGVLGFVVVAWVDYIVDVSVSFLFFYLVPITLAAWFAGRLPALAVALLCAIAWFLVNGAWAADDVSHSTYWNAIMRLGLFLVVALLASELRLALDGRSALVRRHPGTELLKPGAFFDAVRDHVIDAMGEERNPFTVAVIEISSHMVDRAAPNRTDDGRRARKGPGIPLRAMSQILTKYSGDGAQCARLSAGEFAILFGEISEAESTSRVALIEVAVASLCLDRGQGETVESRIRTFLKPPATIETMIRPTFSRSL